MIDLSRIGVLTQELMDTLEEEYGEREDVQVGVAAVILEVNFPAEEEIGTVIHYRCSDPRRWVQAGLFDACWRCATESGGSDEEEE